MAIGSSQWMYNSGDYELEQSLRFDSASGSYLQRTPLSVGNRQTYTLSMWFKIGKTSGERRLFSTGTVGTGANDRCVIDLNGNGELGFQEYTSSVWNLVLRTTSRLRDPSAWYHAVFVYDITQATQADRVKIYINGIRETVFNTETIPNQNHNSSVNTTIVHRIATYTTSDNENPWDGYLGEINFIDGQALTPSSFGETGDYGEWKPKRCDDARGTNGFYLPFKQDYAVEGFSTVTWKGNGASSAYIGGTGFSPDLLWIKRRDATGSHCLLDTVRGNSNGLHPDTTSVQWTDTGVQKEFNTDGFTVGNHQYSNNNGGSYVAWNWDMGNSYGLPHTITASGATNHSTAQQKFGTSSILFDGTTDKLTAASHADFNLLEKDFTFDMWVNFDVISNFQIVDIKGYADGLSFRMQEPGGSGKIGCYIANNNHTWNWVPSTGTWYHLALVRYGDSLKCYVDGSALTATAGGNVGGQSIAQGALQIGQELTGGTAIDFDGYIDDWRFSNIARYTGNFTVPSTTNTNDSNTILLIQSNTTNGSTTFVDSSGAAVNTSGTITSNVSANPSYGQSIVSYSGTGSAATVGHGLASAPTMVIVKSRVDGYNWGVWHTGLTSADYALQLNTTIAQANTWDYWNDTAPSSSVFSVGTELGSNKVSSAYIAYCFHDVAGYSKFSSYEGTGGTHTITTGFAPAFVMIKNADATGHWTMWDNTRNPNNPVTQLLRANTSGAEETKTDREPSFLSTGFSIGDADADTNASGQTYIYAAFADTREYAYWYDQSGNNNDWTSNNLTESDIMVDSPTNNFATLNPLVTGGGVVLSEGNLKFVGGASTQRSYRPSTIGIDSGKFYFEGFALASAGGLSLGICIEGGSTDDSMGKDDFSWSYDTGGTIRHNNSTVSYGASYAVGDIISAAVDIDNGTIVFSKNGASQGSYSIAGFSTSDTYFLGVGDGTANSSTQWILNFGQDSSFAGAKTSQGNQDSNDIGDFYYAPPTGFLALCTANLPSVDVIPSEHFNTVLYTGGGGTQSFTGVGFQPDLIWQKKRSNAGNHTLADAVRGTEKRLQVDNTSAEDTLSGFFSSFNSDGFTTSHYNDSGESYVAWNWKAGGSTSSNTNGSVNSTVSVNAEAGFSILTFTCPSGSGLYTVGHGLGAVPEFMIVKSRSATGNWHIYHKDVGNAKAYFLNNSTAGFTSSYWGNTTPTSTVFTQSIGASLDIGTTAIGYCFNSVDNYSKVGSYIGNGSDNGTFVNCGFRPAFVMTKRTDATGSWCIVDTKRPGFNGLKDNTGNARLRPDTSGVEDDRGRIDILSNGFKIRASYAESNNNGSTYIFLAFAETPFKYSNAR